LETNIPRTDGVSEDESETWLTIEAKAKQVLKETLNMDNCVAFVPEIER